MSVLKTYADQTGYHPSKTWQIKENRIEGTIDGLEAVRQAIALILQTERYRYPIYSPDYGVETADLHGRRRDYVQGDIERRIIEALMEDDRITGVRDFAVTFDREAGKINCTVITVFGTEPIEERVVIG